MFTVFAFEVSKYVAQIPRDKIKWEPVKVTRIRKNISISNAERPNPLNAWRKKKCRSSMFSQQSTKRA